MDGKNEYTLEEISKNDGQDGNKLWVLIGGKVYDVTKYKHPGGREIFEDPIGEDRKDEFEAIGHSPAAIEEMKKHHIGFLKTEPKKNIKPKKTDEIVDDKDLEFVPSDDETTSSGKRRSPIVYLVPVMVLAIILFVVYNLALKN
jgi:cytochrome b involved in lipid metabolism